MRLFNVTFILAAVSSVVTPAALANPVIEESASQSWGSQLAKSNHYGAPIPPWQKGCKPGWYYGNNPKHLDLIGLGVLPWLKDSLICLIINLLPLCLHCPNPHSPPKGDWTPVFTNLEAAVRGNDYLTYGLVDTVDDCKVMCADVDGCVFFNTYHDNNGKGGSPLLTCALFSGCHTAKDADNAGGQTQPDGSLNYITESAGYCKK